MHMSNFISILLLPAEGLGSAILALTDLFLDTPRLLQPLPRNYSNTTQANRSLVAVTHLICGRKLEAIQDLKTIATVLDELDD